MPQLNSYGQSLKYLILSLCTLTLVACASTQPPAPTTTRIPVAQRPVPTQTPAPTPRQPETQREVIKEVETPTGANTPVETEISEREVEAPQIATGPYFNNRQGLTPPHMVGRNTKRLAILLPFSTQSTRLAQEAQSMYRAAELAVFNHPSDDVLLIALDTKGTESGARSATRAAVQAGADVILGPIIASNVNASAREARRANIPVIAFSNDQRVAGNGTYLMSFPPEAEINRVVDFIATTGTTRFAFLGPDSAYGNRVKNAYQSRIQSIGGEITASESYKGNDISVMQAPAQRLAAYHAEGEALAEENGGLTPMSFEAILLPEGGTPLRSLAPLLPYYEVDPADVQFIGTSRWADPETVKEPALGGGVFAGPDKDTQAVFSANYDRTFGETPTGLASLAYDAVVMGAFVADGDPRGRFARAENPSGFYGVDGLVSFGPDGRPERGLAVYRIENGKFVVLDPAPREVLGGS